MDKKKKKNKLEEVSDSAVESSGFQFPNLSKVFSRSSKPKKLSTKELIEQEQERTMKEISPDYQDNIEKSKKEYEDLMKKRRGY